MSCEPSWPRHPGFSSAGAWRSLRSLRFANSTVPMPIVLCSGSSATTHCFHRPGVPTSSGAGFGKLLTSCVVRASIEVWMCCDEAGVEIRIGFHPVAGTTASELIVRQVCLGPLESLWSPLPLLFSSLAHSRHERSAGCNDSSGNFADQSCRLASQTLKGPCSGITTHPWPGAHRGFPGLDLIDLIC